MNIFRIYLSQNIFQIAPFKKISWGSIPPSKRMTLPRSQTQKSPPYGKSCIRPWLMPLASQYLLLLCIMSKPRLKCSLGSLARLTTLL